MRGLGRVTICDVKPEVCQLQRFFGACDPFALHFAF